MALLDQDSPKSEAVSPAASRPRRKRDAERSKQAILRAAIAEFCSHGFTGARVERIAKRSKANMRMLYHYFGSKEGLYMAVLESVYGEIRQQEQELDLASRDPVEGLRQLVTFTFDFFATRRHFISLINNENILKGKFLRRSGKIRDMTGPLIASIQDLLRRGAEEGVFRSDIDAVQLYVSIVAQSQIHISNRYTLSILFDRNLMDRDWLAQRREHSQALIMNFVMAR